MREKTNLFVMVFVILSCVGLAIADDTQDAGNAPIIASVSTYAPDGNFITDNSGTNTVTPRPNNDQNNAQASTDSSAQSNSNAVQ